MFISKSLIKRDVEQSLGNTKWFHSEEVLSSLQIKNPFNFSSRSALTSLFYQQSFSRNKVFLKFIYILQMEPTGFYGLTWRGRNMELFKILMLYFPVACCVL